MLHIPLHLACSDMDKPGLPNSPTPARSLPNAEELINYFAI